MQKYAYAVLLILVVAGCGGPSRPSGSVEATAVVPSASTVAIAPSNKNIPTATALKVDSPKKTTWTLKQIRPETGWGPFKTFAEWQWTIIGRPAIVRWYDYKTFVQFEDNEIVIIRGYKSIAPGKTAVIREKYSVDAPPPPHQLDSEIDIVQ